MDWKNSMVNSVIKKIRETFEILTGTDFEYIIRDVLWQKNEGTTYTGEWQLRNGVAFGRKDLTDVE